MRVLVTGGAGFIGQHVCSELVATGHEVIVLDDLSTGKLENLAGITDLEFHEGSVLDSYTYEDLIYRVDAVVHLAAKASLEAYADNPKDASLVNVRGVRTVLEAVDDSDRDVQVVYASSAAVYGDRPVPYRREDETELEPLSQYGVDKYDGEDLLRHHDFLRTTSLRFFNVYGPGQDARSRYSGVITRFIERSRAAEPHVVYGDGNSVRDYVYVGDVARAVRKALVWRAELLDEPGHEVVNVGTGVGTSVRDLSVLVAQTTGQVHGVSPEGERPGDIRRSVADVARAGKLGIVPAFVGLSEGLRHTWETIK